MWHEIHFKTYIHIKCPSCTLHRTNNTQTCPTKLNGCFYHFIQRGIYSTSQVCSSECLAVCLDRQCVKTDSPKNSTFIITDIFSMMEVWKQLHVCHPMYRVHVLQCAMDRPIPVGAQNFSVFCTSTMKKLLQQKLLGNVQGKFNLSIFRIFKKEVLTSLWQWILKLNWNLK